VSRTSFRKAGWYSSVHRHFSSCYKLLWKSWKCVRLVVDEMAGQRAETQKDLLRVGNENQRSASGWTHGSVDTEDRDVWPQQPACFFVLFFARFLFFYKKFVFVHAWRLSIILLCYVRTHLYLQLFYYGKFVFQS